MQHSRSTAPLVSGMTPISLAYCIKITKKFSAYPIAQYFLHPVDLRADNCPNYYTIIKRPMDLGRIMKKLEENQYSSPEKWKEEMNLVWSNAMQYNPPATPFHEIAKELKELFRVQSEVIPRTETEAWALRIKRKHEKLALLLQCKPEGTKRSNDPVSSPSKQGPAFKPKIILRAAS